tara:strand:+ start:8 stop:976 length:969 start_codon:yes stop_codon:yes gene_type:complete
MKFSGSPLEYTGTGLEIFIGFLKVFFLILLPYSFFAEWALDTVVVKWALLGASGLNLIELGRLVLGVYIPLICFYSVGSYLAFRYRVNRTQWRGIRGSVQGSTIRYAGKAIIAYTCTALSLGLAKPWADMNLLGYKLQNASFGQRTVGFRNSTTDLWKPYLTFWFSIPAYVVVTFALAYILDDNLITQTQHVNGNSISVKYSAKSQDPFVVMLSMLLFLVPFLLYLNYRARFWQNIASNAQFGAAKTVFNAEAPEFFKLVLVNYLITIFSLGLLLPLTWLRKGTFLARHLTVTGNLNEESLVQAEFDEQSTGEGLLGDFDIA